MKRIFCILFVLGLATRNFAGPAITEKELLADVYSYTTDSTFVTDDNDIQNVSEDPDDVEDADGGKRSKKSHYPIMDGQDQHAAQSISDNNGGRLHYPTSGYGAPKGYITSHDNPHLAPSGPHMLPPGHPHEHHSAHSSHRGKPMHLGSTYNPYGPQMNRSPYYSRQSEYHASPYQPPLYQPQSYSPPMYQIPSQSYTYLSPGPQVPCSSNILVSCKPHVSQVPCSGYSSESYPIQQYVPAYVPAPTYGSSSGSYGYRANAEEENKFVSSTSPTIKQDTAMQSEKAKSSSASTLPELLPSSAIPATGTSSLIVAPVSNGGPSQIKVPTSDDQKQRENISTINQQQQTSERDESVKKQQETMMKMAQMAQMLSNTKDQPQPIDMNSIQTQPNHAALGSNMAASSPVKVSYFPGNRWK